MPYLIQDRILFLSKASSILSSSLDYNVTLASVAKLAVENIADLCVIDIFEEGKLKRVTVRTSDPKQQKIANAMYDYLPDPSNKRAVYDAAKDRNPILIKKVTKSWLKTVTKYKGEMELHKKLNLQSIIFAPLVSRDKVVGVLSLASSANGFHYNQDDALLASEIASRAGIAVDKARLYMEAQQAIKMRDDFLSIASHELKTPLTVILMNLQTALRKIPRSNLKTKEAQDITRMVEVSIQQSQRMSRLINDLLNISVIASGRLTVEKEDMDLAELIHEIIDKFKLQLDKNNIKVNAAAPRNLKGKWDKVRLEQVVTNLISNAIKYGEGKPIDITLSKNKNLAELEIKDRGIGVPSDKQAAIFENFTRAVESKKYQGMGVGLFISRQIVEAHGGTMTVESSLNKGSKFTVRLPI